MWKNRTQKNLFWFYMNVWYVQVFVHKLYETLRYWNNSGWSLLMQQVKSCLTITFRFGVNTNEVQLKRNRWPENKKASMRCRYCLLSNLWEWKLAHSFPKIGIKHSIYPSLRLLLMSSSFKKKLVSPICATLLEKNWKKLNWSIRHPILLLAIFRTWIVWGIIWNQKLV